MHTRWVSTHVFVIACHTITCNNRWENVDLYQSINARRDKRPHWKESFSALREVEELATSIAGLAGIAEFEGENWKEAVKKSCAQWSVKIEWPSLIHNCQFSDRRLKSVTANVEWIGEEHAFWPSLHLARDRDLALYQGNSDSGRMAFHSLGIYSSVCRCMPHDYLQQQMRKRRSVPEYQRQEKEVAALKGIIFSFNIHE